MLPRNDEGRQVRGRTALDEHAARAGGQAREVAQEAQRLVLGVHRARRLDPRDPGDRRARHDHVEQERRLRRRGRDECEEARAVARDDRGRQHVAVEREHLFRLVAGRVDRARCAGRQLVGIDAVVERDRVEREPLAHVREHGVGGAAGSLVESVHGHDASPRRRVAGRGAAVMRRRGSRARRRCAPAGRRAPTARSGGRNLEVAEPRARLPCRTASGSGAQAGPRASQLVFGAAERDVQEPPLFGARRGSGRPRDRDEPALEARHEHDLPFETLGAVERHEVDALLARGVGSGREIEPRDEAGNRRPRGFCVEVVAAEVEQRVAVLARVVARRLVGVGGEVGEVVGERARRAPRVRPRATGRAGRAPRAGSRTGPRR